MCFISKSQKNVPANNCHLKVHVHVACHWLTLLSPTVIDLLCLFSWMTLSAHSSFSATPWLRGGGQFKSCTQQLVGSTQLKWTHSTTQYNSQQYTLSLFVCMYNACVHMYVYHCQPCTMRRDFEGCVYWNELAGICSNILRVAGFRDAVRFQGNRYIHVHVYIIVLQLFMYTYIRLYPRPQAQAWG